MSFGFLSKIRSKREKKAREKFEHKTIMDRLEEEGFKPLIKGDILEGRIAEVHATLQKVLKSNGQDQLEWKGELIDGVFRLIFVVSSAWLRSMDNAWLSHKINCFIQNYRELRHNREFLDMLFEEAMAILNISFTNIDVEPLRPIIIQSMPFGGSQYMIPSEFEAIDDTKRRKQK